MTMKEQIFNKHSFRELRAISPSKSFCLNAMEEYAIIEKIGIVGELIGYGTKDQESLKYMSGLLKELSAKLKQFK
jgi:hypothetical protein